MEMDPREEARVPREPSCVTIVVNQDILLATVLNPRARERVARAPHLEVRGRDSMKWVALKIWHVLTKRELSASLVTLLHGPLMW